jgi:hypothetical protein
MLLLLSVAENYTVALIERHAATQSPFTNTTTTAPRFTAAPFPASGTDGGIAGRPRRQLTALALRSASILRRFNPIVGSWRDFRTDQRRQIGLRGAGRGGSAHSMLRLTMLSLG